MNMNEEFGDRVQLQPERQEEPLDPKTVLVRKPHTVHVDHKEERVTVQDELDYMKSAANVMPQIEEGTVEIEEPVGAAELPAPQPPKKRTGVFSRMFAKARRFFG